MADAAVFHIIYEDLVTDNKYCHIETRLLIYINNLHLINIS